MPTARARWIVVTVGTVVIVLAATFMGPSEERRVRRRLEAGAEALSALTQETGVAQLGRLAQLRAFLAEDVVVYLAGQDDVPIRGRDEIVGLVARVLAPLGARVELERIRVTIRDGGAVADAGCEARLVSQDPDAQSPVIDARWVSLTWKRFDNTWVVASARVMESDESAIGDKR